MKITLTPLGMETVRAALELYIAAQSEHFVNLRGMGETAPLDNMRSRIVEAQGLADELRREMEWPVRKAAYDRMQAADATELETRALYGDR